MSATRYDARKNQKSSDHVISLEEYKIWRKQTRNCNLCSEVFKPSTRFERFCQHCKEKNELYRFSEWLSA